MRLKETSYSSVILFDLPKLQQKIDEYEAQSLQDGFRSNQREASKIIDKKNSLIEKIKLYRKLESEIKDLKELVETLDVNDDEMGEFALESFNATNKELQKLKIIVLFNGEYDSLEHYLKARGLINDLKAGVCK